MTNRLVILGICAFVAACSGTASTSGGTATDLDATGTDVVLATPDVDVQSSGKTDASAGKDVPDVKTVDVPAVKDVQKVQDVPDVQATPSDCLSCLTDDECASGWFCAQFQGSSYCAKDCSSNSCAPGHTCTGATSTVGDQLKVCVPVANPCATSPDGPDVTDATGADASSPADVNSLTCGSLVGPDVPSCCKCSGKSCTANGCYGGWFCNVPTCKCHPAPDPTTCGSTSVDAGQTDGNVADTGSSGKDATTSDTSTVQSIGPTGGTLSSLDFAIVGDTRPPAKDDLKGYPTSVITKIFQDVQSENPPIPFVVTTGDYQFSSANTTNATPQFDLYLQAQAGYAGAVFHAMGNHECTGATDSNCGTGNKDGTPTTYKTFMTKMLGPLGVSEPWYAVNVNATDGSWTAKFVFVAANAWSTTQATWLDAEMAKPTTYTFVVRHEGGVVTVTPGVTPSAVIFNKYPYTLLLVGHTHTFAYFAKDREVVTGNGGAPLATGVNYGYTVLRQRADKAMVVTAYDYATHATIQSFVVKPDGTPTK